MNPVLDVHEICSQFPDTFVLVDHCKFSESASLTHGRVLLTADRSDTVYEALRTYPNSLIFFTGIDPEAIDDALLDRGAVRELVV